MSSIWPADALPAFSIANVHGEITFVDPEPPPRWYARMNSGPRAYVEVVNDGVRWPIFCDLRQLGISDSFIAAIKRKLGPRLILTRQQLLDLRQQGQGPQVDYTIAAFTPRVLRPGVPCTIFPGALDTPFAGHNVALVPRGYRYHQTDGDLTGALLGMK